MSVRFTLCAFLVVSLLGCEGKLPDVQVFGTVVPHLSPPTEAGPVIIPSTFASPIQDKEDGMCEQWVTEQEVNDCDTGELELRQSCAEGGDVESTYIVGSDDCEGTATFSKTYQMRDGTTEIWQYQTQPCGDELDVLCFTATSNGGEAIQGEHQMLPGNQSYSCRETWNRHEGTYRLLGVCRNEETESGNVILHFNGTLEFDDPNTEHSPDWTLVNEDREDGSRKQVVTRSVNNWKLEETIDIRVDQSYDYEFFYDDMATVDILEFDGVYSYLASGSGVGGYLHTLVDGSELAVKHQISIEGDYKETWVFGDSFTEQVVDQTGELHYNLKGRGVGTLTTYVVNGDPEICDLIVEPDGTSIITNCH